MWRGLVLCGLLGACIDPSYGPTPFLCERGACPSGYRCVAGVCRSGSTDLDVDLAIPDLLHPDASPDATPDAPDAAPAEAGPPDSSPDHQPPPGTWFQVKPGSFSMGAPASETCRESDETQHPVTLKHGFEILTTPVTRKMYSDLMGYLPTGSPSGCASCPVALVSWHEAAQYCNTLSVNAGLTSCYYCTGSKSNVTCVVAAGYTGAKIYTCPGFRLPTEAEWEYACRATTTTSLYSGNLVSCDSAAPLADQIAWYSENSSGTAHAVGQKSANTWGIHDMAGNVWEWCHDRYSSDLGSAAVTDPVVLNASTDAVRRGGSYASWPRFLRSANRGFLGIGDRDQYTGLRCVRSVP